MVILRYSVCRNLFQCIVLLAAEAPIKIVNKAEIENL
jgi:hypothetical protein